jgi:hypothetical protein
VKKVEVGVVAGAELESMSNPEECSSDALKDDDLSDVPVVEASIEEWIVEDEREVFSVETVSLSNVETVGLLATVVLPPVDEAVKIENSSESVVEADIELLLVILSLMLEVLGVSLPVLMSVTLRMVSLLLVTVPLLVLASLVVVMMLLLLVSISLLLVLRIVSLILVLVLVSLVLTLRIVLLLLVLVNLKLVLVLVFVLVLMVEVPVLLLKDEEVDHVVVDSASPSTKTST